MTVLARAFGMAWRSLVRQPSRAALAILGVAAIGALLFDMLLLSQGLVESMRDLLNRTGYDVRVTATEDLPRNGPRMHDVPALLEKITALPAVQGASAVRFADADVDRVDGTAMRLSFEGVTGTASHPWNVLRGKDVAADGEVVINNAVAAATRVAPGGTLAVRLTCTSGGEPLPPTRFRVVGIAEFPFELTNENTMGGTMQTIASTCGDDSPGDADVILVTSSGNADAAVAAIHAVRSDLGVASNEEVLGRIERTGFTYFRQISTVLTTVTLSFAMLLIAVLLTVSVNQRLGEIAALRALGLSQFRVVADVLCESALIVGAGGLLSLPLGAALATALDAILKRMPGIPAELHFFVFERSALEWHVALLATTALLAALYPMRIVARLPIAATLRDQVVG
jgi:ABC-type lipoprotein release transport system permease subunit